MGDMARERDVVADSAVRAAGDLRVAFSRLRRRLLEVDAGKLSPSQTSVLRRLHKEGPASASELAAIERVRPQSMAATLTALDEHALITRSPDARDGRRQVVSLTDAGRERAEGDREARREWLARAFAEHCTEGERQTVIKAMALLERIAHQ